MKQKLTLTILLFLSLFIISCSDNNDSNNEFINSSEAMAEFDNNNFGIYKGIFVGSSGIIIVNINNDNTISAKLTIDGMQYDYTTSQTVQENQATNIVFENGNDTFTFSVSSDGNNPTFTELAINGHSNASIIAIKETSNAVVKLFEGSYNGEQTGIFNAIIYQDEFKALVHSLDANINFTAEGEVNNTIITTGTTSTGTNFSGNINGNKINGIWNNSQSNTEGNWSGTRTY
ncbi:hypothetical protein [Tenacibaculum retecalamus]|uniref:hypothetical protein n=1 Tax=Tenacibaculum retecalamus TaxID=3018315 RepID=UPI0023D95518|nr:hypothetical protein [Tenacibaculum retecalamus]WBX71984.1 hypothetical protein PG912_04205 [Tenacibaculum retecalamus]